MRRLIGNKDPILTHAAPYAMGLAKHSGDFVAYTLRGQKGAGAVGWCLFLLAVIFAPYVIYDITQRGLWALISLGGVFRIPIPLVFALLIQIVVAILSLKFIRSANSVRQVVIETKTGRTQIQARRGAVGGVSPGKILIRTLQITNAKDKIAPHVGQDELVAVIVCADNQYEILGAFKSDASAQRYANLLVDKTGVAIDNNIEFPFDTVHAFWNIKPGFDDEYAINNPMVCTHALEPVEFRTT